MYMYLHLRLANDWLKTLTKHVKKLWKQLKHSSYMYKGLIDKNQKSKLLVKYYVSELCFLI